MFACFISDIVLDEAGDGDAEQVALRLEALKGIPKLVPTMEGERLAAAFLADVLPSKAAGDEHTPGPAESMVMREINFHKAFLAGTAIIAIVLFAVVWARFK